jgi:hypothetical protein
LIGFNYVYEDDYEYEGGWLYDYEYGDGWLAI